MAAEKRQLRRCATYSRKSSEEGLEQDFNSLDAQREACEAYIRSQVGEGWKPLPDRYEDGGFSGGNINRPGLQKLLTDIEAGKIDIVVVYKVDRLTRSLTDFSKIVEVLDDREVSFVSVTQQFNTTTSMGRLTLNMLLSFAQFEREVTGERIRDKIAASKRKGLWMGGNIPLGYEADGRTLKILPGEAETVRTLFLLYRELRSAWKVKQEADRLGLRTKLRTFKDGRRSGGGLFRHGHIHRILHNPLYIGQIQHKGVVYDGQHDAIVDLETWEATRIGRSTESERRGLRKTRPSPYALRGKLVEETGVPLETTHSTKKGRRYRYYLSPTKTSGGGQAETHGDRPTWRLSAREIEALIERGITQLLSEPARLAQAALESGIAESDVSRLIERSTQAAANPMELVERAELHPNYVALWLDPLGIADGVAGCIRHDVQMEIRRRGVETRLVLSTDSTAPNGGAADPALVKSLVRARAWFSELAEGRARSLEELGRREEVSDRFVGALVPLAFLAPDIVAKILSGTQPVELTTTSLMTRVELPLAWADQRALLEFE